MCVNVILYDLSPERIGLDSDGLTLWDPTWESCIGLIGTNAQLEMVAKAIMQKIQGDEQAKEHQ